MNSTEKRVHGGIWDCFLWHYHIFFVCFVLLVLLLVLLMVSFVSFCRYGLARYSGVIGAEWIPFGVVLLNRGIFGIWLLGVGFTFKVADIEIREILFISCLGFVSTVSRTCFSRRKAVH